MSKLDDKALLDAMDKVTVKWLNTLEPSEEVELNEEYTLYHYTEDDIIVIVKTEEWEEILQILYDPNGADKDIVFESLI